MKKLSVSLAMLALVLAVGLAFVGCKSEVEDDPLNGTYAFGNGKFILNNGKWNMEGIADLDMRGTYETNEDTITFTTTDIYIPQEFAAEANTTAGWKNKSQFTEIAKGWGGTDDDINGMFAPFTGTYSGNTLWMWGTSFIRQ